MEKINITWLYPDIFNLHGDRGNIMAFMRVADMLGIALDITRAQNFTDAPDFENADIIYVPPGETVAAMRAADAVRDQKEAYEAYLAQGKCLFVIGTSLALYAGRTQRYDGSAFDGLGLVDVTMKELRTAYTNDAVVNTCLFGREMQLVGGQIQMLKAFVREEDTLGENVYGYGNDKGAREGVHAGGFIQTNLLGPVLVKNPWFAEALLA
jgi:CobQ-like glutamine amidotransferase family enzyme